MIKSEIIRFIEERVRKSKVPKYSSWTIGITADPETRKSQHGNPGYWLQWEADRESDAREIEKHFLDKGMKGDTGGGQRPIYVYIF